jgi:cellulose synthase/poly-beta-1,6-N-acetylglucosamine synthase-like glycosyltransferase
MTPKKNALSVAISISSGKIIVTTDADCRVPKNWVTSMVNVLINSPAGIAIGYSTITAHKHSVLEQYQKIDFLALMAANAGSTGWGFAWSGSGQNLAYYREHFDSIGGFQPVADRLSGDDVYLVQSIGKKYGAIFNNNADGYVHTIPIPTTFQFLRQRIRWASNSRHLPGSNWFFLSFLISAFICNTALITALFFSTAIVYLPIAIIIKFLIDGLVIFIGANQFRTHIHPAIFILWSFLQPVYIPLIGITGLISQFTWKD